ncbi:SulP family inorganic anion transporter [Bosea sp. (in: a-proteobacteria)]|uniref:SulP family inorganic anion transporter n=1 Tax=Bosea sp. (in: a-proteobacteria) TaxID=1871050 RepID=UPI001ACC60A4|nr:SulP family inorganic anion transporter [Bosea sp. (in: a-proteobacteria)]MBN9437787.1 SulP family inorganic anion transporter [Bosea sp. (in: a-proteobacteria)]
MRVRDLFPASLVGYRLEYLRFDVTAGLAVAAVAIPSAIAYPAIAGLPAEVGLYASILPLVGYALFGPSRKLMVGPDAATMTVLAAALATMPLDNPADRVAAAAALALLVGLLCILAGRLSLGVVASFLSRPILIGFISGISISILIGQIGRLTGVRIESDGLVQPLLEIARKVGQIHWPSLGFGAAMFGLLVLLARLRSPIPGPLVVVALAAVASALFDLEGHGMKVIGSLPSTMPSLKLPDVSHLPMRELLQGAAAVWLVSVSSGLVAARSFAARDKFDVDADRELTGLGFGNIFSGLFSGFPITVSDSRTAINISAGGRSQIAGLVAALALTALLLYLNDTLRLLPNPALGAILAFAALSLIDLGGFREIWRVSRTEFAFALISMWGAISLGVLSGVVIAIAGTLLHVLLKEMRPRVALLGRIAGRPGFYKLHRSERAAPVPGMVIFLVQGSILFFNTDFLRGRFENAAQSVPPGTKWFLVDASAVAQIDTTGVAMLQKLRTDLSGLGLTLVLAELHREPWEILHRAGFFEGPEETTIFDDVEDAVSALADREPGSAGQPTPARIGSQGPADDGLSGSV